MRLGRGDLVRDGCRAWGSRVVVHVWLTDSRRVLNIWLMGSRRVVHVWWLGSRRIVRVWLTGSRRVVRRVWLMSSRSVLNAWLMGSRRRVHVRWLGSMTRRHTQLAHHAVDLIVTSPSLTRSGRPTLAILRGSRRSRPNVSIAMRRAVECARRDGPLLPVRNSRSRHGPRRQRRRLQPTAGVYIIQPGPQLPPRVSDRARDALKVDPRPRARARRQRGRLFVRVNKLDRRLMVRLRPGPVVILMLSVRPGRPLRKRRRCLPRHYSRARCVEVG